MFLHFNSIKVQLERHRPIVNLDLIGFQFHKGTIRTDNFKMFKSSAKLISIP